MNKGSIVERLCSDLDRKEPRYKCPTLLYFTFTRVHSAAAGTDITDIALLCFSFWLRVLD